MEEGDALIGDRVGSSAQQPPSDRQPLHQPRVEVRVVIPAKPLSSIASTSTESFQEKTGQEAGSAVAASSVPNSSEHLSRIPCNPFKDAVEFGIVQWFMEEKVSKGAINRFLRSPFLQPITRTLSLRHADDIHQVLQTVLEEKVSWISTPIYIPSDASDMPDHYGQFRYRPIVSMIDLGRSMT